MVVLASAEDGGLSANGGGDDTERDASITPLEQALQHSRRREILRILCEHDGELSLSTLATRLAEDDGSLPATLSTLYDLHLPKLEEEGLVAYGQSIGVRLQIDTDRVARELQRTSENG